MVGILSRGNLAHKIALNAGYAGRTLQILLENQGRINYHIANDFKGIMGDVLIDAVPLTNWTVTGLPLDDVNAIEKLVTENIAKDKVVELRNDILTGGPVIYHATFDIDASELYDTYVNTAGWGKVCTSNRFFNRQKK